VRRLALASILFRRDGWFPEVLAAMSQLSSVGFEQMKQSPMYQAWSVVAPDVDAFPALMDKTGDLLRRPYDWTEEIKQLSIRPFWSTATQTASRLRTSPSSPADSGDRRSGRRSVSRRVTATSA